MKAELLSHYGDDNMAVNVARVSYGKEASNYTTEQNSKLIKYLVNHKHTSPFRHPQLQFRITCPIYVERQLRKHEVGIEIQPVEFSINSISGRYVDFSDSYYEIKEWRLQSKTSKQGSAGNLPLKDQVKADTIQNHALEVCATAYNDLIKLGVSKEQARSVLPLSLNTQFIWTGSFLAFIHLCNLRLKEDTQQETRELVQQMAEQVKAIPGNPFELSLNAFGY